MIRNLCQLLPHALQRSLFFLIVTVCISACDSGKTKPNFSDKTPPSIKWIVTNAAGQQDTITGNGTTAFTNGEGFHVMALVKDEGGIVEVTTSSAYNWDCLGDILESPVSGPEEHTTTLSLDSEGKALNLFPIGFDLTTLLVCPPDLTFQQGTITLKCSALNFGNLKTEVTLSVHVNRKF